MSDNMDKSTANMKLCTRSRPVPATGVTVASPVAPLLDSNVRGEDAVDLSINSLPEHPVVPGAHKGSPMGQPSFHNLQDPAQGLHCLVHHNFQRPTAIYQPMPYQEVNHMSGKISQKLPGLSKNEG